MHLQFLSKLLRKKDQPKQTVLFHRDYLRFQGGHLKVFHYFQHLQSSASYLPYIYFTEQSLQDSDNPWQGSQSLATWRPADADILFLAGLDWQAVLQHPEFLQQRANIPVINLIQGLSHAEPKDRKYAFLRERAIRICVSEQVSEAIQATGQVNGPIFTIPNGIDLASLPKPLAKDKKDLDLLIVAIKKPDLGLALAQTLADQTNKIHTIHQLIPRPEFLKLLNRAKTVICLPHLAEGFYLPALEAMALGALVICPDCRGNRSFCIDQYTCLRPVYELPAILAAFQQAKSLDELSRNTLLTRAKQQVALHSLEHEAEQFLAIMRDISKLW